MGCHITSEITPRWFAFYFDSDKKKPGIQLDFSGFERPLPANVSMGGADPEGKYKGVRLWDDEYGCDGPALTLLEMDPKERNHVYRRITKIEGKTRAQVFGDLASYLERLQGTSWFNRYRTDLEPVQVDGKEQQCWKNRDSFCVSEDKRKFWHNREVAKPDGSSLWCPSLWCFDPADVSRWAEGEDKIGTAATEVIKELRAQEKKAALKK